MHAGTSKAGFTKKEVKAFLKINAKMFVGIFVSIQRFS